MGFFAQIYQVYPEAYKLSQISVQIQENRVSSLVIEFPIDPVAERFLDSIGKTSDGKDVVKSEKNSAIEAVRKFANEATVRRSEFQKRLESLVLVSHEVCSCNLNYVAIYSRKGSILDS